MARLLDWPRGQRITGWQRLAGPRSVGATSNESIDAFVQTVSSAFGAWRWQLSLPPAKGRSFRRYRGTVTGLHGGANAMRIPFLDPDGLTFADAGMTVTPAQLQNGVPFGNGKPCSNGQNLSLAPPPVPVSGAAEEGDTLIVLRNAFWGYSLAIGDRLGFFPFHFGVYEVTEVFGLGKYRITPPLRKALALPCYASLRPVLAARPESETAGTANRGAGVAQGNTVTVVEVFDADVRAFFADVTRISFPPPAGAATYLYLGF